MSELRVQCYAGYKADQRPLRFNLKERVLEVVRVEDQWYGPSAVYFRVLADDGNIYILKHDEVDDRWTLDGYRAAAE